MAYNFEATFTQPLLTQLDNGIIKGAESWADAITKAYITTIKAGLPQGAPPTVPAPAQNGAPYPIGASGFTTADSKSKVFYTIVHAYFYAKEIKLEKGAIQGLVTTVKQLILKIKARYRQVKTLVERIKQISEQLKELPKLLQDIVEGIKAEIKEQVENVKGIFTQLQGMELELGPAEFQNVFREELTLIESVKNFDPTNIAGIRDIALFVSEYGKRTNSLLAATDSVTLMKKYIRDRLFGIAKEFIQYANAAIDPSQILSFISQLAAARPRLEKLVEKVKRFDLFIRYIQPQLKKLEKKKNEMIKNIRVVIQPKLIAIQKKLSDKTAEFIKKLQSSKAVQLYKNAKKNIDDFKKRNEKKIKKTRSQIQLLTKAMSQSRTIVGKSTSLIEGVKGEFKALQEDIEQFQNQVQNTIIATSASAAQVSAPAAPDIKIDFQNLSAKGLKAELSKLESYFGGLGLGQFANIGALVMTQTKCSLQTFKRFFESRNKRLKQYVSEVVILEKNIRDLLLTLQQLKDTTKRVDTKKSIVGDWLANRVKSLKDLMSVIVKWIDPSLKRIQAWINKKINQLKTFIKEDLKKFAEDLKVYAINLIPLKSDVQDKKDKVAIAEDKIKKIKHKIAKIKKLIKLAKFVADMVKGSLKLTKNVLSGNMKLSENQGSIDTILNGLYGLRMEDQSASVQKQLMIEKAKFRDEFKGLLVIESLVYAIIETIKDIKNTDFKAELQDFIDNLKSQTPGAKALTTLMGLVDNPPKSLNELKAVAEQLGGDILADVSVITKLQDMERRHLNTSREVIKKVCSIKQLEGTKFEKRMLKIKDALDKNQSFIALAFKFLKDELKKFNLFINKKIDQVVRWVKAKLQKKRQRVEDFAKLELDKIKENKINIEAPIMTFTFGLAARLFWTGATWTGPTGTNHITLNIGAFKPMKAKSTDGASVMIREIAKGFETQLSLMSGLIIPPPSTGITPLPFTGYK